MTGRDPILNRRIASIFVNEFENFISILKNLPSENNADNLRFNLHKLRPSLVIFEMDKLIKVFDNLTERKSGITPIEHDDAELHEAIHEANTQLRGVKTFLEDI